MAAPCCWPPAALPGAASRDMARLGAATSPTQERASASVRACTSVSAQRARQRITSVDASGAVLRGGGSQQTAATVRDFAAHCSSLTMVDMLRSHRALRGASTRQRWDHMVTCAIRQRKDRDAVELKTLSEAFRKFDLDGNGTLDRNELRQAMEAMGMKATDQRVCELFVQMDRNRDGDISIEEWFDWMSSDLRATVLDYIVKFESQKKREEKKPRLPAAYFNPQSPQTLPSRVGSPLGSPLSPIELPLLSPTGRSLTASPAPLSPASRPMSPATFGGDGPLSPLSPTSPTVKGGREWAKNWGHVEPNGAKEHGRADPQSAKAMG